MASITPEMLSLLLSNCIKQFGKQNTLKLDDQELQMPSVISLHTGPGYAILVLLEGQKQIDQWQETQKKLEEHNSEIPERTGELVPENEQPGILEAGSRQDPVRSEPSGSSNS